MAREDVSELANLLHDEYIIRYGIGEKVPVDQVKNRAKTAISELELKDITPVQVLTHMVSHGYFETHGKEYIVS